MLIKPGGVKMNKHLFIFILILGTYTFPTILMADDDGGRSLHEKNQTRSYNNRSLTNTNRKAPSSHSNYHKYNNSSSSFYNNSPSSNPSQRSNQSNQSFPNR
jgi:hypothetical protein